MVALIAAALGLFALTYLFYSWDREFLENANVTRAVVTDKDVRSSSTDSSSSNYSVSYRWNVEDGHEYKGRKIDETWSGSASWAGGEELWSELEPGVSTVEIAWRYADDRRSTESRLVEHGFIGVPWPMLFLGIILIGIAVGRIVLRVRKHRGTASGGWARSRTRAQV